MKPVTFLGSLLLIPFAFLLVSCSLAEGNLQSTEELSAVAQPSSTPPPAPATAEPTQDPLDHLLSNLQATPVRFVYPTPGPLHGPDWRPPPYQAPMALRPEDHFYFRRPIPSDQVNWPHPEYRYGNTFFGELAVHTGVDLGADFGTPVLASGSGEIIWTGYGLFRGFENLEDPYGLAIAIRHDFGYKGEYLYTVYAHLSEINVWLGQHVEAGEHIGKVGNTGHSSGPHLHFEVRLGSDDYFSTVNPELWIVPPEGWAILAGRVTNTYGLLLNEFIIEITNLETERVWNVWTYAPTVVNSDENFDENFVISDLPAGPYEIRIVYYGVSFRTQMYLYPGQTNTLDFRGWKGFQQVSTKIADLTEPPFP